MYYQLRILVCWMIGAAYAFGIFPSSALGQSLLSTSPVANKTGGDPFAIGKTLLKAHTLDYFKLDDLIEKNYGNITKESFYKYSGRPQSYLDQVKWKDAGFGFEAWSVMNDNREWVRTKDPRRHLLTALEGNRTHPADGLIVKMRGDGYYDIIGHTQWKSIYPDNPYVRSDYLQKAIDNPRYDGMTIRVPSDNLQLLKQKYKSLDPNGLKTTDAILIGKITDKSASGGINISSYDMLKKTIKLREDEFIRLSTKYELERAAFLSKSSSAIAGSKVLGKTVAGGLVIIGIAAEGYQTYTNWERYRSGEIGGDHFTTKLTMQGAQIGLAGALFAAPEPIVTKIGGLVVIVLVFAGADQIVETSIEKRQEHAKHILETIDRDERFHSARQQLLQ